MTMTMTSRGMGEAEVRDAQASRRIALGVAAVMAFAALGLASPGAAEAAVARCDGRKMKTLDFSGGQVRIYRTHTFSCAVTVAKHPGKRRHMSVSIQARGSHPRIDTGYYTRHAGPVRVVAGHRCIFVRGSVGRKSVKSGWILC